MTAYERWEYNVKCPQCGRSGTVQVRELDGWPYMHAIERGQKYCWTYPPAGFHLTADEKVVCDCSADAGGTGVRK